MKKNLRLLFSIIILSFALVLSIYSIYGWYVSNKNTDATGITGTTYDDQFTYSLEKYDATSKVYTSTNLSFSNIKPNDVFYFRLKFIPNNDSIDATGLNFNISFNEITSSLISDLTYDSTNTCITYNDVKLYALKDNKVSTDLIDNKNKVIYKIDNNKITLQDCKIENTFKVYGNIKNTDTPSSGISLKETLFTNRNIVKDSNSYYYYFALEFNEELSLETIEGVKSSNAYMFQKLEIKSLKIARA